MRDFFKFMFASMLGFFLTTIILFFLLFGFVMALVSLTKQDEVVLKGKSILHLKFDYPINDRSSGDPFSFNYSYMSLKSDPGLNVILKNIKKAKNDDNIQGIFLDLLDVPSGLATINEIRNALQDFKTSGKFVLAYGEILSQRAYYLATVADKVFLNPVGMLEFRGFAGEVMFIKGLLSKLEIEPQIIRHGKYKSAIEPLILDKMSEENKEQTLTFVQSMWDDALDAMAKSRNLSIEEMNRIADHLEGSYAADAYQLHLVDSVIYYDQLLSLFAQKIDVENIQKDDLISLSKYDKVRSKDLIEGRSKNKIAVIYASGSISQGEGSEQSIGSDKIARTIRNARLDKTIKAIVLRVNSPGGDGFASDVILREVDLANDVKPVVVSMGDYAASGGYYIACKANKIFAHANTITGSIGVFGVIPNLQKFLNNKIGITFDGVKTNENADFINVTKPLSPFQTTLLQREIDRFYSTFINHVAEGRNIPAEKVDEVGQGRVWTGTHALEIGLVDELGGLDDAIAEAVKLANLTDHRVVELPVLMDPFEKLIKDLMGESSVSILQKELGSNYKYLQYIKDISQMNGIQARLPFEIEIH